jgi:peptidoglycan/xylan/chitin deacetylase (PgdA/CDA1 family)
MTARVCLTFDVDGPFVWLGTFGARGLQGLSRGEYEVRVGLPRVLELLREKKIAATFFVPGRFAQTYPALVREISVGPHEVAAHGYNHERWSDLSREAEVSVLDRSIGALSECLGRRPRGFRAPGFELNPWSIRLLVEAGFSYDSSLMGDDFTPYRPALDNPLSAEGPLYLGTPAPILEFPVSWELDDFPYFAHTGRSAGLRSAREVGALWWEEWEYARSISGAVYTLTLHPQVIGRGPRIRMLAELIDRIRAAGAVSFTTLAQSLDAAGAFQQSSGDQRL